MGGSATRLPIGLSAPKATDRSDEWNRRNAAFSESCKCLDPGMAQPHGLPPPPRAQAKRSFMADNILGPNTASPYSNTAIAAKSQNIPHHASKNDAFLERATSWFEEPVAVVTPHSSGLPDSDMIDAVKLMSRGQLVYQAGNRPGNRGRDIGSNRTPRTVHVPGTTRVLSDPPSGRTLCAHLCCATRHRLNQPG